MAQRWAQKKKTCVAEQIFSVMVHNYKSSRMTCFKGLNGYTGFQLLCTILAFSVCVRVHESQGNRKGILFWGKQLINTVANFWVTWCLGSHQKKACEHTWICLYFLWRAAMINPSSVHATISRASCGKLSFSITRLWYLPAWNGLQDKWSVFCIKKRQC